VINWGIFSFARRAVLSGVSAIEVWEVVYSPCMLQGKICFL
jgi:hypothetical protein